MMIPVENNHAIFVPGHQEETVLGHERAESLSAKLSVRIFLAMSRPWYVIQLHGLGPRGDIGQ